MPTTITVRADVERASREIKQVGKDLGTVGDAARDASSKSADALDKVARELSDVQREAKEAGQAVGQIDDYADFGDLQKQANAAQAAIKGVTEASKNAAPAVAGIGDASKRTGEFAKGGTEALVAMVQSLVGGGGVEGAANASREKLGALAGLLSGPWGAAVAIGVTALTALAAKLFESGEAGEDAAKGIEAAKKAMDDYIASIENRISHERDLSDIEALNADQAQQTADALSKKAVDTRKALKAVSEGATQQQETLERLRAEREKLEQEGSSEMSFTQQWKRLNDIAAEQASTEERVNRLQEERLKLIEQEAKLREKTEAARSVAARKRIEESQTPQSGSLPPAAAAQQKVDQQAVQQRKAQATESLQQAAKQDAELRAQHKKQNADYINALREAHKDFIDGIANQLRTPEGGNVAQQVLDSVTPDQIAQTVGQQRFAEREEELRKQFEAQEKARQEAFSKRREDINRNATNPSESGLLAFNEFGAQSQRARSRFNQELERERRQIQRQAYRDTTSGNLNPEEMRAAQQANVEALTSQAQASGNLNSQTVEALNQSTQQLLQNQSEIESLQNTVSSIQNTLKQSQQQGTRRRAQMGGAPR